MKGGGSEDKGWKEGGGLRMEEEVIIKDGRKEEEVRMKDGGRKVGGKLDEGRRKGG
jgi:hypothetical protein